MTSFVEPRGHTESFSKLERFWKLEPSAFSLQRRRVRRFDSSAGMSFSPMEYQIGTLELDDVEIPGAEAICSAFTEFVRNEFGIDGNSTPIGVRAPEITRQVLLDDRFLAEFLTASEALGSSFVPTAPNSDVDSMAGSIFELLCDRRVGSRKNSDYNSREEFAQLIAPAIESESRLLFVLPGFPFKDQNRFRVPFGPDLPDLAEVCFMIRLHQLTQAIYQVHPYGADVLVLTDGSLYCDIFGISRNMVEKYQLNIRRLRNEMNLQGTVSFIPLLELMDRVPRSKGISDEISATLRKLLEGNETVGSAFDRLVFGMKRNMDSRSQFAELSDDEVWIIVNERSPDSVPSGLRDPWLAFDRNAREAALKYASINLMLRLTKLIEKCFTGAIRGTVHPKRGQFALSGSGGAYAWNGVAWSKGIPRTIEDVVVRPFAALADHVHVTQYLLSSSAPAFFA